MALDSSFFEKNWHNIKVISLWMLAYAVIGGVLLLTLILFKRLLQQIQQQWAAPRMASGVNGS